MFSATRCACRPARPAILASASDTSPIANTLSWPATCNVGPDRDETVGAARRRELVVEVVADRAHAEALEPHVGGDLATDSVVTVNGPSSVGAVGGSARKPSPSASSTPISASWARSSARRSAPELVAEHVVGDVEQDDVLVGPRRLDLARELDADRTGADQQHALGACSSRSCAAAVLLDRVAGVVEVALGRERIRRARSRARRSRRRSPCPTRPRRGAGRPRPRGRARRARARAACRRAGRSAGRNAGSTSARNDATLCTNVSFGSTSTTSASASSALATLTPP